jgi:hypothetical protein
MGRLANAIGCLTVAIAVAIVSLQVAYLLSQDSIAEQPLASNKPLIDITAAVMSSAGRTGDVYVAPRPERAADCDALRVAYH